MPPFASYLVMASMIVYVLAILIEFALRRSVARFALQLAVVVIIFAGLHFTVDFPSISRSAAFGGASPLMALGIMYICVLAGIAARYVFYLEGPFSWLGFVKPICISPMVLLPLFGSVQGTRELNDLQVISFGFLAFQNGFFWQALLEKAKPISSHVNQ